MSNTKPVSEGTVIMADSQYAGRGQQQNRWHSEAGKNLTFSLLLRPVFLPVTQQFDLTRAVSLGIVNALRPYLGDELKVKWPNDIYYKNAKLGGILIENLLQGAQIKNAIIGIGLNINQEIFPAEAGNPVSMKQILHRDYDLKILLSEICKNIETAYLSLKAGRFSDVRKAYLERLYILNEDKIFKVSGRLVTGKIIDVREQGLLVLETADGLLEFNQKEIEFLHK